MDICNVISAFLGCWAGHIVADFLCDFVDFISKDKKEFLKEEIQMSLSAFFNPVEVENKKVVVSKRFVENGKPVEWEIKTISEEEEEAIRKSCTIKKKEKNGTVTKEIDDDLFSAKIATACIVYPDLHNAELQDHYHAIGAEDLLKKMLTGGEYWSFVTFIQEFNSYGKSLDDMVDEVKN